MHQERILAAAGRLPWARIGMTMGALVGLIGGRLAGGSDMGPLPLLVGTFVWSLLGLLIGLSITYRRSLLGLAGFALFLLSVGPFIALGHHHRFDDFALVIYFPVAMAQDVRPVTRYLIFWDEVGDRLRE